MSNPFTTRPLAAGDLDPVIALDRKLSGRARRGFFETRLAAALREPKAFLYIGLTHTGPDGDGALAGYVMARLLRGEFGGDALVAQLDAIGVDPEFQGKGAGRALMRALDKIMRQKGVTELQSQVDWTNHTLTGFLAKTGFTVAPRIVLERGTGELQSQVDWTNHTLTGFLAKTGFTVAPRIVLERGTGELPSFQADAE